MMCSHQRLTRNELRDAVHIPFIEILVIGVKVELHEVSVCED